MIPLAQAFCYRVPVFLKGRKRFEFKLVMVRGVAR